MTWVFDHLGEIGEYAVSHALLAGVPLLLGFLLALPIGWLARRRSRLAPVIVGASGLLYTIPSLALFILLPLVIGTGIIDAANVYVAMTIYTVALLVRTVVDALNSVPESTLLAAIAMGYRGVSRAFAVELPLAVPVLAAGLRVAAASNVSIVSVAALIGQPQLGFYLTDGYQRDYPLEIGVGLASCMLLALLFDLSIRAVSWALTPWTHIAASGPDAPDDLAPAPSSAISAGVRDG